MADSCRGRIAILSMTAALFCAAPAGAQSRPPQEVFVGWAPVIGTTVDARVLPAWTVAVSRGRARNLSPAVDVSGWYVPGAMVHSIIGGPRYTFETEGGNWGFVQVLAGAAVVATSGVGLAVAVVPGGGVDVPVPGRRFSIRVQGDMYGVGVGAAWGGMWRLSTGLVFHSDK